MDQSFLANTANFPLPTLPHHPPPCPTMPHHIISIHVYRNGKENCAQRLHTHIYIIYILYTCIFFTASSSNNSPYNYAILPEREKDTQTPHTHTHTLEYNYALHTLSQGVAVLRLGSHSAWSNLKSSAPL